MVGEQVENGNVRTNRPLLTPTSLTLNQEEGKPMQDLLVRRKLWELRSEQRNPEGFRYWQSISAIHAYIRIVKFLQG